MKLRAVLALATFPWVLWACLALAAPPGTGQVQPGQAAGAHAPPGKVGKPEAKASGATQNAPSQAKKKIVVKDVQVYSGRDYSRIVLVLSGQAERRWGVLPQDPGESGVRRLYVDLEGAYIRPGVPKRFDVRGDVARKVRLSYFKPDVARLVVEVENLKDQQVFELENPSRLIVDVKGEAPAEKGKPGAGPAKADAEKPAQRGKAGKPAGRGTEGDLSGEDRPGRPGVNLAGPAGPGGGKTTGQPERRPANTVRTVMIDAGRGGRDQGATGVGGLKEKDVNLTVAKLLGAQLTRMGFEVLQTRATDTFVPQEERTAMANARQADLFLSIHCNASPDHSLSGLETYSLNLASTPDEVRAAARENSMAPRSISDMQDILDDLMHASKQGESRELALCTQEATLTQARKCLTLADRGVHEAPFYVLLGARMPAVLVEVGYLTNPAEAAKLKDQKYLEALARGLADGVMAYRDRVGGAAAGK